MSHTSFPLLFGLQLHLASTVLPTYSSHFPKAHDIYGPGLTGVGYIRELSALMDSCERVICWSAFFPPALCKIRELNESVLLPFPSTSASRPQSPRASISALPPQKPKSWSSVSAHPSPSSPCKPRRPEHSHRACGVSPLLSRKRQLTLFHSLCPRLPPNLDVRPVSSLNHNESPTQAVDVRAQASPSSRTQPATERRSREATDKGQRSQCQVRRTPSSFPGL